jgi:hypothetical protein
VDKYDEYVDIEFGDVFAEFEHDHHHHHHHASDDTDDNNNNGGPRLRRAAWFDARYYADPKSAVHSLGNRLTGEIAQSLYSKRTPTRRRLERTVCCIIVNFLRVRICDPGRYLAVLLGKSDYDAATYRSMTQAFKGLEQLGYVRKFTGSYGGLATRFGAEPRLLEAFAAYRIGAADVKSTEKTSLVELRISGKERRRLDAKRDRERKRAKKLGKTVPPRRHRSENLLPWPRPYREGKVRMERNLRKINNALRDQFIALHVPDDAVNEIHKDLREESQFIDYFDNELHRVFTIDPTHNGRFAGGWWSTLPKQYRKHIRMSGPGLPPQRTTELDYRELHLRIVYARKQKPCTDSPYELYDDPALNQAIREPVKLLTLIMLNADTPFGALRAMVKKVREKYDRKWKADFNTLARPPMKTDEMAGRLWPCCPPIKTLMADIVKKHEAIKESFSSGAGRKLMYEDSQLAERIMLRMIDEHGVVVLPLHDGFVVCSDYRNELLEIMEDEFQKRFGADTVNVKETRDHRTAFPTPEYYFTDSAADAAASRYFDFECERDGYGIYHALLDDWISRQPEATQPEAHAKTFADSDSSVHYAVGRITALYSARKAA